MKKNLAIVGYGGMGAWHATYAKKSDVINLAGVYDIDDARQALAEEEGIHAYKSLDDLLADENVDIVTIAVPNDSHLDLVVKSLKAGKHVVCEKPVAMSSEDLQMMIDTAKSTGSLFTVHQNRRWDGDYLSIKNLVESGEIGTPFRIESRVHGSRGIPGDWRAEKEHGGGMMLDWGVHLIDQLLLIYTQPIKTVQCQVTNITNGEVDDGFYLTLIFEDGRQAYIEVGTYNFISLPRFYMKADEGTAQVPGWNQPCTVARCTYWHQKDVKPVETAAGLTKTMAPRDEITIDTYEKPNPASDVHEFYRNFVDAIDGKAEQLVTHEQVKKVMRVMELAFQSDASGMPLAWQE